MDPITAESPDAQSADLVAENIAQLKALFPELVTEAADGASINVDVLKQLVGDQTVTDVEEKYGLNWHGKRAARKLALTPSLGTLRPCPEESKDWDTTQNLFIEGDNLEVLKLLQKSYAGKVKLIYIDPPYNTGKDFVYPDNFKDNIRNYKELTGQLDEEGRATSSNSDTSGRFHTDWLNMMYPRLKTARNLMQENGIIFISIDDNELTNLRTICDEIFGEENFYCTFVWQRRSGAMDSVDNTSVDHEYVVCYGKNKTALSGIKRTYDKYSNPDNDPRGPWILDNLSAGKAGGDVYYPITDPDTGNEYLPPQGRYWPYNRNTMQQKIFEGRIVFPQRADGRPMLKRFQNEAKNEYVPVSTWLRRENEKQTANSLKSALNTAGTKEAQNLLGGKLFSHPKPTTLLKSLYTQGSKDGIILDFFAGSCSSGHAVLDMNREDKGSRRHIMVQIPEQCEKGTEAYKAGYKTITEIGKERLRRAAMKIQSENPDYEGDLGFRVFKLDSSNIKAWNAEAIAAAQSDDEQAALLSEQIEHLLADRTEDDILYELLLKLGLDLCVPIEQREIAGKTVYSVGSGVLMICLADTISYEDSETLAQGIVDWHQEMAPATEVSCVFRDSGFTDDKAKANTTAILDQAGLKKVRSI